QAKFLTAETGAIEAVPASRLPLIDRAELIRRRQCENAQRGRVAVAERVAIDIPFDVPRAVTVLEAGQSADQAGIKLLPILAAELKHRLTAIVGTVVVRSGTVIIAIERLQQNPASG